MEKLLWEKPEMKEVVFAADSCVSACTYSCSIPGKGWFMLEASNAQSPMNNPNGADYDSHHSTATQEGFFLGGGNDYLEYFNVLTDKALDPNAVWNADLLIFDESTYDKYAPCGGHETGGMIDTNNAYQGWYLADEYVKANQTESNLWQKAWLWLEDNVLHAAIEGYNFERNRS